MNHLVNIADLDPELANLVDRAAAGDEVVIARGGEPVARIVGMPDVLPTPRRRRKSGLLKHLPPPPDDFFDPLTEEEIAAWHGDVEPARSV